MSGTDDALVLHRAGRVVVRASGASSPSVTATSGGAALGRASCAAAVFGTERLSAGGLLRDVGASPGVHPGSRILNRHVADGSLRLASLRPLAVANGGTGNTSFEAGAVVAGASGPQIAVCPGLSWDGGAAVLSARAGASVGGLSVLQ